MLYGVGVEEGFGFGLGLRVLFAIFFGSGYHFVFSLAGDEFGRHFRKLEGEAAFVIQFG